MASLYSEGWRQGTIFTAELFASRLVLSDDGAPESRTETYDRWVVCSQNCDLAAAQLDDSGESAIEVRRVTSTEEGSGDWGVRSAVFLLSGSEMTEADASRIQVSPQLLQSLIGTAEPPLPDGRAKAFKTWLGLRYDRPAVPDHLVEPAREVAKRCGRRSGRQVAQGIHDVLMQFDDSCTPPKVILFAIRADDADHEEVRLWVAEAAQRIRTEVCVVAGIYVGTRAETSLELIESSYAADLSQLTWGNEDPSGAE